MRYSEAKQQIEALSSKYSAYKDKYTNFFNVNYKNAEVAYVRSDERYSFNFWSENNFQKLPFSNKLYMILSELAMTPLDERIDEKKYRVKAFDDYLNLNVDTLYAFLFGKSETEFCQTCFTLKEIKQLKQREDIPLDWNKVILEEANEN